MTTKERLGMVLPVCICLMVFVGLSALLARDKERFNLSLPRHPWTRNDIYIALSIAAVFYLVGLWRLGEPRRAVFDECYHGRSGMEYILGLNPTEWTHPPLGKLLIATSLEVWGGNFNPREGIYKPDMPFTERSVIGWRFASLVAGSLALIVLYILARSMLGSTTPAAIASGMLACDGIFFVQSRIAMTNAFTVLFILVAALGAWKYRQTAKQPWMLLLAFGLGCAVSTRWTTLFALGLLGLYLCNFEIRRLIWRRAKVFDWLWSVLLFAAAFLLIPAAMYVSTYIPYMRQGHDLNKVWSEQHAMWDYHTGMKETHGYSSPWWSWPLTIRPTWYAFDVDQLVDARRGIVAIGNAGIWWASIPAMLVGSILAIREKRVELGLPALLATGLWLMWAVQGRSLVFQHYMLEGIPFVCILLSALGCLLWQRQENDDTGALRLRRAIVGGYGAMIVVWFVFWYPLLSAYPVTGKFFDLHLWLGRLWV
ncbi:MAG: phospholipid carrier-dependent glycosyltransferase [Armatimonas sp.]